MRRFALTALVLVLLLSVAGCAAITPVAPAAAPAAEAETVFEISGTDSIVSLTAEELKALPAVTGMAGIKSSTGEITLPREFKGVAVSTLLGLVPGFDESAGVMAEAKDGYTITYSYNQAMNADFIFYDPITGDEKPKPEGSVTLAVVYEDEGQPISDDSGPLRMMVLSPEGDQVVDGHWAVKWVRRLIVKDMAQDWTLNMEGGISAVMDRGTFESGAAPGCHGASWVDEGGQEWSGIPLWRLAGWADDEIKHEGPAFSDELAKIGYEIEVIAADGYSVVLHSERVTRNDELLVAYLVNGEPLPEKYFPLRLVGEGLDKSEMVGNIATIRLHVPESVPVAAAPADLNITGLVSVEFGLSKDALSRMEMVTVSAQAPKADAPQDFTGVRLVDLLGQAEPAADASILALVAYDGYESEVDLAQVLDCGDCLIGFDETGKLRTIMPDFGGGAWVKDVIALDVRGAAAEEATEEEPAAEAVTVTPTVGLQITGLVANQLDLSAEDLAAIPGVLISAQHPKADAPQDWTGYRLSDLLGLAGPLPEADTLVVIASDGYQAQLPLAGVAACADCLVAVEEGLLRMVMPGQESPSWVKDVATLELTGPAAAEPPAEEPGEAAVTAAPTAGLEIKGLVANPLALSPEDLAALPAATVSAQHPKADAAQDWTGYRLNDLLALVEPQADAANLVITAADGFQASVPMEAVAACSDCLVAVDEGLLRMVMPDQDSKAWVKDVAALELQ